MFVQNTGAYLLRFMNLYCCENLMFSPLCCHLLRVSVGSGSLHLVTVPLMAGSGVTSCGWLNLHSSVMRAHQAVSRTVAHVVNRRSLTVEDRIRSQASPCRICGRQSDTGTGFPPSTPVNVITPRLHTH